MGETSIEWSEHSWNPIVGCSVVSPGCTNCYAMRMAERLSAMAPQANGVGNPHVLHYVGTTTRDPNGRGYDWMDHPVWTGKVALAPESVLLAPLRRRKPTTWFVNSMGDLFHENVPDEWIDRVFAVMALTARHEYQVLTKRSARMRAYCSDPDTPRRIHGLVCDMVVTDMVANVVLIAPGMDPDLAPPGQRVFLGLWPLSNVWLGVSAEDQRRADERVPDLLATPAAVRFVSAEPLLGPIDFNRWAPTGRWATSPAGERFLAPNFYMTKCEYCGWIGSSELCGTDSDDSVYCPACERSIAGDDAPRLDWIIVGGESGPGARPMHPDWARSIRDQCAAAGVPFFFKQWGNWREAQDGDTFDTSKGRMNRPPAFIVKPDDGTVHCFLPTDPDPRCRVMLEVGKKAAGRLLDGVEHNAMPGQSI